MPGPQFVSHLDSLRLSKKLTDEVMEIWNPGHHAAGESMSVAWDAVFTFFCEDKNKDLDLDSLQKLANIMQLLACSHKSLRNLEIKVREHQIREEEFEQKKECVRAALNSVRETKDGLTEATLLQIEEQLKLL